ncbi:Zn-dependent exopeptidase M28 [Roseomonas sp. TAS13]|uniref:Zn-dependent exopeptidase M28 n=1 Tax=Roseomonas sp. TAS13 TaxID=1926319 RepID=UPI0011150C99|nr:Zn-dependent exopeptidase M28 [Roseomonas sp. TAS13]
MHVNVDSTGGIGATSLTGTAVTPEAVSLATDAIAAETGQHYTGKRPSHSADQSFWGVGIPSMFGSLSMHVPGTETFGPATMRNALGWWWHTPHDLIDKIDESFLMRDTRVFVHVLWRLLTEPTLLLQPLAAIESLLRELRDLAPRLPETVPAAMVTGAAEALLAQSLPSGQTADRSLVGA